MIKLLIGGSPCTYWSIAQSKNRETEPSGLGWELFKNYLIAKEKFQPDFFLYENNKSAAKAIKDAIKKELQADEENTLFNIESKARYIEINSALVSAQNRERFYVHNCGDVKQPKDRGILLKDILKTTTDEISYEFIPINATKTSGGGKARTIVAVYYKRGVKNLITSGHEATGIAYRKVNPNNKAIYHVENGFIEVKGELYPIDLPDGDYLIRKLTVTECCRLQTLPDDYCRAVSKSQAYKGLGNGWTAEVIIHILNEALKDVPKDEEIQVLSMYDGIGTGRYCLDKMGFKNVKYYAYEIDKYAMQIAKSNYPDIIECGDAFQVRENDWKIGKGAENE